ncbi:unnamed protein product, partial [Prunus brigantina]
MGDLESVCWSEGIYYEYLKIFFKDWVAAMEGCGAKDHQLPLGSYPQTLGTSEIANIIYFSHSIRGHRGVGVKNNFP